MNDYLRLHPPLDDLTLSKLKAGDRVLITGIIYTARDAAHRRLSRSIAANEPLPIPLKGQIIYYVGPCPAKPGQVIGSAGPTTSGRVDVFTPLLLDRGVKGMIGKGSRSSEVIESMKKNKAVYFAATGGTGALIAKTIKSARVVAYEDLGPEAIYRLEVEDFPAVVVIDSRGKDLYEEGKRIYKKS